MTDIAPELLEAVSGRLQRYMATDKTLGPLVWAIRDGKANYQTVNRYAIRLGELLSDALRREISVDKLPDGRMYYNIAERVLGPLLENNHELVADAAEAAQNAMNAAAGIGMKAVRPELNRSRVDGLIEKVSSYESYVDAERHPGERGRPGPSRSPSDGYANRRGGLLPLVLQPGRRICLPCGAGCLPPA